MNSTEDKKQLPRWPFIAGGVVLLTIILIGIFFISYQKVYAAKFYHGVFVADVALGGKNYDEARRALQDKIDQASNNGFIFSYKEQEVKILPEITSETNPDLSYRLINFELESSLKKAYAIGRTGNFLNKTKDQLIAFIADEKINVDYQINNNQLIEFLEQNLSTLETPYQDTRLTVSYDGKNYATKVTAGKIGKIFDYQFALEKFKKQLKTLDTSKIELNLVDAIPTIQETNADFLLDQIAPAMERAPLTLKYQDQSWKIEKDDLIKLLDFYLNNEQITLGLNKESFIKFLTDNLKPAVNQEAKNSKLMLANGKVTEFQGAQSGVKINEESTWKKTIDEFFVNKNNEIEIVVDITEPDVALNDVNDLGIKEIIGVGLSDFVNSPANRVHNITVGAKALNGLLVKPNEEFSIIKALGDIDATTGYLPELVIKGNKTTPEYGGGLCQIGTTFFRGLLASGLPITERQNHSYRVSYYEPAGTDATIYIPHPDLRFINDTGNYILVQTKIIGTKLRFEFWGTKDGRKTHFIGKNESDDLYKMSPKISNLISPAETKIVETLDLPVGQKKCTEKSHVGATTDFTYTVTYPGGEVKEEEFHSVYHPWQAVCLIGVEKLTEPVNETTPTDGTPAEGATTTNDNSNSNANTNANTPPTT